MKYVDGTIKVGEGWVVEDGANPPVIIQFYYVQDLGDLNQFSIVFSVTNYSKLSLIRTINGISTSTDVSENEWFGIRDEKFDTVFQLKAKNQNSTTSSGYITVRRQIIQINTPIHALTASLSVSRVADTPSGIVAIVTIGQMEGFENTDFDEIKLDEIKLYYRKQGSESWEVLSIDTANPKIIKDAGGNISKYDFELSGKNIKRDFIGGHFDFYVEINAKALGDFYYFYSQIKTIFFENIQIIPSKKETQTFPKAEILDADKAATLRYEIKTKFSEEFVIQSNSKKNQDTFEKFASEKNSVELPLKAAEENDTSLSVSQEAPRKDLDINNEKNQSFLNAEEVAGLTPNNLFIYTSAKEDGETQGYMFPACVSEILPCILISKLDGSGDQKSKLIILFWKINDDFFNYSFLSGQVSVRTDLLVVKVQYKNSSGTYIDLTKEITLTQEEHYNPEDNKFVLGILREDVPNLGLDVHNLELFDLVNESDNYSDNLRILIVEHKVYCSTSNGPNNPGTFTFNKLLMPHEWKYICYDKFLGKNAAARIGENKLSLGLNSPYLRGIRLPEKGFACFDKLTNIVTYQTLIYVLKEDRSDLSVFYKLSSVVEVFYSDPVLKGTINSIELPKIPDDVFLIPPDLEISAPNLIKSGIGSEQAQGIVKLNEYGKISSVELSVVGQGYSQYKTIQSKREQSESDIVPIVLMDYVISNKNLNINKQFLNIKNLSFDRLNLKASLNFGVRLSSVSEDIKKATISARQQLKIDKYLQNNFIENVEVENNSVLPYITTPNQVAANAIKSLDATWDIILKLYSENISSLYDELTIYNQDLDPGVSEFADSQDSSLVESSKDASSITAIPTNLSATDYFVFALVDLEIIPDGSPAVSITSKTKGTPWLTILPMSERADGTIGYGALPNMAPRAEMFNRLAIGVNHLNKVRLIVPQVLRVKSSQNETCYLKPDIDPFKRIASTFSQGGKYSYSTSSSTDGLANTRANIQVSAAQTVTRRYEKSDTIPGGVYIISCKSSASFTVTSQIHPLFHQIISNLNLGRAAAEKSPFLIMTEIGSCGTRNAEVENGHPVIYCFSVAGPYGRRDDGSWSPYAITQSTLPDQIVSRTFSTEVGMAQGTLEANGAANVYSLTNGNFRGAPQFCGQSCSSYKTVSISPQLAGFYPQIFDV